MRKMLKWFTFLFVVFMIASCEADYIAQEPASPDVVKPPDDTIPEPPQSIISYAGEIQPVFSSKCMPCHEAGKAPPVLENGKSYQSLMSIPGMVDTITPDNSTLYKSMKPGGSMSTYCKKSNADSVYKWIKQGAKNN